MTAKIRRIDPSFRGCWGLCWGYRIWPLGAKNHYRRSASWLKRDHIHDRLALQQQEPLPGVEEAGLLQAYVPVERRGRERHVCDPVTVRVGVRRGRAR